VPLSDRYNSLLRSASLGEPSEISVIGASVSELSWEASVRWLLTRQEYAQLVKDCYYDQPVSAAARRFEASEEWRATLALLPPNGGCALDIGAGQGVSTYALGRAGYRVTALEPDPSELVGCGAIARLGDICDGIVNVVRGVAEDMPFGPDSFDLVYCRQALHHARDVRKFCEEAARVLKPGGTFIAVREHVISSERDLTRFLESHVLHRLYGGERAYRSKFYVDAMRCAGLSVMRVIRSFDSPINYSPLTASSLVHQIESRVHRVPGAARLARRLGSSAPGMRLMLRALSLLDRRPGRLNSFLCVKPPA
jgi:SAM-dependent methyltransferase